jgi:hypothetical protein
MIPLLLIMTATTILLVGYVALSNGVRLFRALHRETTGSNYNGTYRSSMHPVVVALLQGALLLVSSACAGIYATFTMLEPRKVVGVTALGMAAVLQRGGRLRSVHAMHIMARAIEWGALPLRVQLRIYYPPPVRNVYDFDDGEEEEHNDDDEE